MFIIYLFICKSCKRWIRKHRPVAVSLESCLVSGFLPRFSHVRRISQRLFSLDRRHLSHNVSRLSNRCQVCFSSLSSSRLIDHPESRRISSHLVASRRLVSNTLCLVLFSRSSRVSSSFDITACFPLYLISMRLALSSLRLI